MVQFSKGGGSDKIIVPKQGGRRKFERELGVWEISSLGRGITFKAGSRGTTNLEIPTRRGRGGRDAENHDEVCLKDTSVKPSMSPERPPWSQGPASSDQKNRQAGCVRVAKGPELDSSERGENLQRTCQGAASM